MTKDERPPKDTRDLEYDMAVEKIAELEGLLSQDTSEFKSAAFQKIKGLEAEVGSAQMYVGVLEDNIKTLEAKVNDRSDQALDYHMELADARVKIKTLESELEILAWNLGGCDTYAMGYDLDKEPAKDMARPALLNVRNKIKTLESALERSEGIKEKIIEMNIESSDKIGQLQSALTGMRAGLEDIKIECIPEEPIYNIADKTLAEADRIMGEI